MPSRSMEGMISQYGSQKKNLELFFVRFDYLVGDQLGKITLGCAVLLGESDWRTDHQLHRSTGTVLCFVSCGLNQTRGFSPGTPP